MASQAAYNGRLQGQGRPATPWVLLMMGIITVWLESSNVFDEKLRMLKKDVGIGNKLREERDFKAKEFLLTVTRRAE